MREYPCRISFKFGCRLNYIKVIKTYKKQLYILNCSLLCFMALLCNYALTTYILSVIPTFFFASLEPQFASLVSNFPFQPIHQSDSLSPFSLSNWIYIYIYHFPIETVESKKVALRRNIASESLGANHQIQWSIIIFATI